MHGHTYIKLMFCVNLTTMFIKNKELRQFAFISKSTSIIEYQICTNIQIILLGSTVDQNSDFKFSYLKKKLGGLWRSG